MSEASPRSTYTACGEGGTREYPLDDHRVRAIFNKFGWQPSEAPIQEMLAVADAADELVCISRVTHEELSRR